MTTVTITHDDGTEETIPETVGWTRQREVGGMRRVIIDVNREDAQAVTLESKQDTIDLGGIDTVRLVDVETGGATWTLVCYSFEWDANREEFTPGGDLREGDDQTLITELIDEVPAWTAGTIESHTGPMSFVFSHVHRHDALRKIERNVPGELRFRDGGAVDYVDSLGSDKAGSVTLSESAGNIDGEIRVTDRGRELDGTHIRVLGAHEGEAQIFANLVPSDDPESYENRVDYTTSRWSDGDPRDWDRVSNKDVTSQATITEEATALGDELDEDLVEAEATVAGEDISVGDWVHVEKSEADLDRDMRVHRITTRREGATQVDDVLLSTRTVMRQDDGDHLRDVQRYNTAWEGASVSVQGGGARQPVDSGTNAEVPFDYPNLEYENAAELHIRGLNYRLYSAEESHSHDVDMNVTSADNSEFQNIVSASNADGNLSWGGSSLFETTLVSESFGTSDDTSSVLAWATCALTDLVDTSSADFEIWVEHDGTQYPDGGITATIEMDATIAVVATIATDVSADDIEVKIREVGGNSAGGNFSYQTAIQGVGQHFHAVDATETTDTTPGVSPGVVETFDTPSNCDVLVNGSTVATDVGSGTFETTVDLAGELTPGEWNMIEVTSDDLGHVQATVSLDGYKQIGASGN